MNVFEWFTTLFWSLLWLGCPSLNEYKYKIRLKIIFDPTFRDNRLFDYMVYISNHGEYDYNKKI